jgi:DNA-binding NarL/FixJ family response regulator
MEGPAATTLLIVDDHAQFRGFARSLLSADGFDVRGESEDGASAIRAVEQLHPDLVLLDVQLPDMDGFEVARRLRGLADAPDIILTSSRDAADYGSRLQEAGVLGFVPKHELSGEALEALTSKGG